MNNAKNQLSTGNAIEALQANAGIRFHLLGRPFVASFSKKGGADNSDIAFVIMPEAGSKSKPCSVSELCDGLNGMVSEVTGGSETPFDAGKINEEIGNYTASTQEPQENIEISINLQQLFLYIRKKPGSTTTDVEYALSISVDLNDFALDFSGVEVISMDSVWISIWNTEIESIRKSMQIEDIDKMLEMDAQDTE